MERVLSIELAKNWRPRLLLLDLDGTLVDSAPDLIRALQHVRAQRGLEPIASERVRGSVSKGGRAILRAGLPELPATEAESHLDELLSRYHAEICVESRLFDGMESLLARWRAQSGLIGIVTNKVSWLTQPLLLALGLGEDFAAVVCGDTIAQRKPEPQPVLHACALAGIAPGDTLFVGDDRRDIEAGRAAGTRTATAEWGYLDGEDPAQWCADWRLLQPADLAELLR